MISKQTKQTKKKAKIKSNHHICIFEKESLLKNTGKMWAITLSITTSTKTAKRYTGMSAYFSS